MALVLVVEDEPELAELLEDYLHGSDHRVLKVVVDALEVVNVEQREAQELGVTDGAPELALEPPLGAAPVVQPGQAVLLGESP